MPGGIHEFLNDSSTVRGGLGGSSFAGTGLSQRSLFPQTTSLHPPVSFTSNVRSSMFMSSGSGEGSPNRGNARANLATMSRLRNNNNSLVPFNNNIVATEAAVSSSNSNSNSNSNARQRQLRRYGGLPPLGPTSNSLQQQQQINTCNSNSSDGSCSSSSYNSLGSVSSSHNNNYNNIHNSQHSKDTPHSHLEDHPKSHSKSHKSNQISKSKSHKSKNLDYFSPLLNNSGDSLSNSRILPRLLTTPDAATSSSITHNSLSNASIAGATTSSPLLRHRYLQHHRMRSAMPIDPPNPHHMNPRLLTPSSFSQHSSTTSEQTQPLVYENCLHVLVEGVRPGTLILTHTHLIFKYDDDVSSRNNSLSNNNNASTNANTNQNSNLTNQNNNANTGTVSLSLVEDDDGYEDLGGNDAHTAVPDIVETKRADEESDTSSQTDPETIDANPTLTNEDEEDLEGDMNDEESMNLHMDNVLIRAIEEEARRRLKELDDESEMETPDLQQINSNSINTNNAGSLRGDWETTHLKQVERRARKYLRKLEDDSVDECNSDNDTKTSNSSSNINININNQSQSTTTSSSSTTSNSNSISSPPPAPPLPPQSSPPANINVNLNMNMKQPTHAHSKGKPPPPTIRKRSHSMDSDYKKYTQTQSQSTHSKSKGFKWALINLTEIYPRRYQMQDIAIEIFGLPSPIPCTLKKKHHTTQLPNKSIYLSFPHNKHRSYLLAALKKSARNLSCKFWQASLAAQNHHIRKFQPWRSTANSLFKRKDPLHLLTRSWRRGQISNYSYLLRLNAIAGRSRHDLSHYPVMPWVLSNYHSNTTPDLEDYANYRDLTKPMGALDEDRLQKFMNKYKTLCSLCDATAIPPFMYGSHYSSSGGVVLHYLVRLRPFAGLHRQLQGGEFDVADRLFDSVPRTWAQCSKTSPTEVKELTPEWFSDPSFLRNNNRFELGTSVHGKEIGDVVLPHWANNSPETFIEVNKQALESKICSQHLPDWIDLIFGYKQRGSEARKAYNVFYHLTYYDSEDLDRIEDEDLRMETELHIADFGHCPTQLFFRPHPRKKEDVKDGNNYANTTSNPNGSQGNSSVIKEDSKGESPLKGVNPKRIWFSSSSDEKKPFER